MARNFGMWQGSSNGMTVCNIILFHPGSSALNRLTEAITRKWKVSAQSYVSLQVRLAKLCPSSVAVNRKVCRILSTTSVMGLIQSSSKSIVIFPLISTGLPGALCLLLHSSSLYRVFVFFISLHICRDRRSHS